MTDEPSSAPSQVAGKGRPTPKRSEALGRRGGPVPPPPTDRKEAARRLKAKRAEQRRELREQARAGDPARMLPRDAGPVRALVRDVVDGRRNLAVVMLPVALVLVVAQVLGEEIYRVAVSLWLVTLMAVLVDLVVTGVLVRQALREHFPQERTGRHIGYALLRTTVLRRIRMPPPRVQPPRLFGR